MPMREDAEYHGVRVTIPAVELTLAEKIATMMS